MKMTEEEARKLASELIGWSTVNGPTYVAIAEAILMACAAESEASAAQLAEANRKLAPSPCGKPGHQMVNWVGEDTDYYETSPGGQKRHVVGEAYCLACRDREQVAAAERERCATTIGGANVQHGNHYAGYYGPSVDAIQLAKVIRSLGPALAIDEIRREAADQKMECGHFKSCLHIAPVQKSRHHTEMRCEACAAAEFREFQIKALPNSEPYKRFHATLDEIRREARDKALVEAINHTCIECEKGLPLTVETDDATGIQYSTHMKKYNGDNGCPAEFLHRLRAKAKEVDRV